MKDIFDQVLRAIPAYLSQVLELLSGPKTFIGRRNLATPKSAVEAYTFLGVTLFLVLIAEISFLPEQKDYLLTFASRSVLAAFFLVVMVGVLFVIWRIVGGKLNFKTFFIVTCYFSGISTLIFAVFALLAGGLLRQMDPDNASQILNGAAPAYPLGAGAIAYALLAGVGFIAVYVWIILGWGAFRKLNNVSRQRSAVALILFTIAIPFLMGADYLIERNSTPTPAHRAVAATLPVEIVGFWNLISASGSESAPSTEAVTYTFAQSGDYAWLHTMTIKKGACSRTLAESALGRASVDGLVLTLVPRVHVGKVNDSCTAEKSETSLSLEKETYPFEIRHPPTGWVLCLSGRYGEQCLVATKPPSP